MKKLLLGIVTLIALTSTTLLGACTQDVNMSGNQIKDLGDPTDSTDAVNKNYVDGTSITITAFDTNFSQLSSYTSSVRKVGSLCTYKIAIQTDVDRIANTWYSFTTVPVGYRPSEHTRGALDISYGKQTGVFSLNTDGRLYVRSNTNISANDNIDFIATVPCQ
jgi:hypothetical protein